MHILLAIPYMAWLVFSALFFAFGEFLSKKFALEPSWFYAVSILLIYSCGTIAWLPAILEKNQLSIVGALWSVLSLVATVLIGVLIFGERLNNLHVLGILFAGVAIALLTLA